MAESTTATAPRVKVQFTVEIGDDKNRSVMCPLFGKRVLRGRFSVANVKGSNPDEDFAEMPDLPGLLVSVLDDGKNRDVSLVDPLGEAKNKALLETARRICLRASSIRQKYGPDKNARFRKANDSQVKNAVYWVRRLLDVKSCRVVSGEVPLMDYIKKMPGSIDFESYDHKAGRKRGREMVDYVSLEDAMKDEAGEADDSDFDEGE